jgi:hypothetical protein
MAITTRAELFTAIDTWSNRSDLTTTNKEEFLALAEAELFDDLLPRNFESDESLTLTQGQNYVALPSGYISDIAFWLIVDGERVELEKVLPEQLPYYTDNSQPRLWAIDGANIRFDCPASEAYTAKFRMLKSSALTASNTTNYLLTSRPDIYLAACMVQFGVWSRDTDLVSTWGSMLDRFKKSFKQKENRSREITLRTDLPVRGRSNIIRDE